MGTNQQKTPKILNEKLHFLWRERRYRNKNGHSRRMCFVKPDIYEILQNLHENTCAGVSF